MSTEVATLDSVIEVLIKYRDSVGGDANFMLMQENGRTLYAPVGSGVLGNGEDSIVLLIFASTNMSIPDEIQREVVDSEDTAIETVDNLLARKDEMFDGKKTNRSDENGDQ